MNNEEFQDYVNRLRHSGHIRRDAIDHKLRFHLVGENVVIESIVSGCFMRNTPVECLKDCRVQSDAANDQFFIRYPPVPVIQWFAGFRNFRFDEDTTMVGAVSEEVVFAPAEAV